MIRSILKRSALFIIVSIFSFTTYGQDTKGWHLKDLKTDGFYGISLDKAYEFVRSKNLKSTPVIVGVIDSGIDTTHEDLKPVLWTNAKEIPGNGIDDDKNGYIDDVHGWNFLGSDDGTKNVEKDSFEAARFYWQLKDKYEGKSESEIPAADKEEYKTWLRARKDVFKADKNPEEVAFTIRMLEILKDGDAAIRLALKKEVYNCKDVGLYNSIFNQGALQFKLLLLNQCGDLESMEYTNKELLAEVQKEVDRMTIDTKPPREYRKEVVNDNEADINDKYYGNNNLYVTKDAAVHGTHVAGIIGAARGNNKGMDGVSDNVKLMSIRAVPDGDEHDKDIALAIRYAVDNGARVINMSFGKGFSPQKEWVDDAVRYAEKKGVLLIHAAGNDAKNNDTTLNYPSGFFLDGSRPNNWITVGASGDKKTGGLVADFSNYGKKEVDVFAPGVKIYSTMPGGNNYANLQGTSMASPVVAGLASFILNYYPKLTPAQLKSVIMKSVSKPAGKVTNPQTGDEVLMSELSVSGGIVNAYEAIKLADAVSKGNVKTTPVPVKKPAQKKK